MAPCRGIKKGAFLAQGEHISQNPLPKAPDMAAPLPGIVKNLTSDYLTLEVNFETGKEPLAPINFRNLGPVEAQASLKKMAIAPILPPAPGDPVIISGFDPEPGFNLAAALWEDQRSTLEAGLKLVTRLFPGKPILLALPHGVRPLESCDCAALHLRIKYPKTLPVFLKKTLLKTYDPIAKGLISSRKLHLLGQAMRSGKSPAAFPMTIGRIAALVPSGLSPLRLLALVNQEPRGGAQVILGGPIRGVATARLDKGLGGTVEGIFLIKSPKAPLGKCLYCARCRYSCPLRLPVDQLGATPMYLWPLVLKDNPLLGTCPACGLCQMACPRGLPLAALRTGSGH
jgi:ferredoxin